MCLVHNHKLAIKCFVYPRCKIRGRQVRLLLIHQIRKLDSSREIVEIVNHFLDDRVQFLAVLGVLPPQSFRLGPFQLVEVPPPSALLRHQEACGILLYPCNVKNLGAEIVLHRRRCDDQNFLILKLGTQDVLFGYLDRSAGIMRYTEIT